MRALFVAVGLAFTVPVVSLAPSMAHALEQDGVHLATYMSSWTSTLEEGQRSVEASKGKARGAAMKALLEEMAPMVAEARKATGAK